MSARDLNYDLQVIQQWAYQWKFEFKPDTIKQATQLLFSCGKHKHMGLILHSKLSFVNEKIIQAKK